MTVSGLSLLTHKVLVIHWEDLGKEKVSADKKETLKMIIIVDVFNEFWVLGQAQTETDHWGNRWSREPAES